MKLECLNFVIWTFESTMPNPIKCFSTQEQCVLYEWWNWRMNKFRNGKYIWNKVCLGWSVLCTLALDMYFLCTFRLFTGTKRMGFRSRTFNEILEFNLCTLYVIILLSTISIPRIQCLCRTVTHDYALRKSKYTYY